MKLFYPFTISATKRGDVVTLLMIHMLIFLLQVKYMDVKVFNLMSEANETNFLVQHESC